MYIPSFEEQADLMAESFPREALDFAWREHPEYMRYLRKGTTTVSAPATTYQAAPAGIPQGVAQAAALDDDIDPEDEAAFAQLQMGSKPAASGSVDDVVAAARAAVAAKLQSTTGRRNG